MDWLWDWWHVLYAWSKAVYGDSIKVYEMNPSLMTFIFGVIATCLVLYVWIRASEWARWRKLKVQKMSTADRQRANWTKSFVGQMICDVIEDAIHADKLTRKEAQYWYLRIGGNAGLPALLSRRRPQLPLSPTDQAVLKESISNRLLKEFGVIPKNKGGRKGKVAAILS